MLWIIGCSGAQPFRQVGMGSFRISHRAIGVNLPIGFLARFGQRLEEILPVHLIQEKVFPPVAPAQFRGQS